MYGSMPFDDASVRALPLSGCVVACIGYVYVAVVHRRAFISVSCRCCECQLVAYVSCVYGCSEHLCVFSLRFFSQLVYYVVLTEYVLCAGVVRYVVSVAVVASASPVSVHLPVIHFAAVHSCRCCRRTTD